MKKINYKILLVLLIFLVSGAVGATSLIEEGLYVSATGSGTNCTYLQPCTFTSAQTKALVGDTIHILGKIGSINVTKSGITVEGGIVDGINNTSQDSASILVTGDSVTIRNIEVINGHSYGIRTYNIGYGRGLFIDNATIHGNVVENRSGNGCNTSASSGWGSGIRAYRSTDLRITNSKIYENCGEGLSSVMSSHVTGSNLQIWDNFSVNIYPDQSQYFTVTDSSISCIKPEYQRFGLSYALLLGAENYSGISSNTTDYIDFERNKIYNCKGVGTYSTTSNTWKNITIINNEFYNVPSPAIVSISGTNIVTSPNIISNVTPTVTRTQLASITVTATQTRTAVVIFTNTSVPSITSTLISKVTITNTPTQLVTWTPTVTATRTSTPTNTVSPTPTRCRGNSRRCRTPQP